MNYTLAKAERIKRMRAGELTDIEQRVLGVILRAPDGLHVREVVSRSMESHKTVEYVLCSLHAARLVAQNGYRGPMARWCKPGLEQHCREMAHAKFYAGRADPVTDAKRRIEKLEARKLRQREYEKRRKFSAALPDEPVRIIGPAREFVAPGPISVFHLGQM